jgi:hypothetical protein
MKRWTAFLAALTFGLAGCSSSNVVSVTGTVTLDGAALPGAVVTFRPADQKTTGLGGSGTTDANGKFVVTGARGEKGLAPGEYAVIISKRLRPDGSAPDPNVPPMESDAVEKLPPRYSDQQQTVLRATVAKDKAAHEFPLVTKK